MKLNKSVLLIVSILALIAFVVCLNIASLDIATAEEINFIKLENVGGNNTITISNKEEIESFVNNLKISSWSMTIGWRLKLFPDYFISINDNTLIGIMADEGIAYAMIEHKNSKNKYYKIPIDVYDYVIYYYTTHNHQKITSIKP